MPLFHRRSDRCRRRRIQNHRYPQGLPYFFNRLPRLSSSMPRLDQRHHLSAVRNGQPQYAFYQITQLICVVIFLRERQRNRCFRQRLNAHLRFPVFRRPTTPRLQLHGVQSCVKCRFRRFFQPPSSGGLIDSELPARWPLRDPCFESYITKVYVPSKRRFSNYTAAIP